MSVYIRRLAEELGKRGYSLDIFTRHVGSKQPDVVSLTERVRLISLPAGPLGPVDKGELPQYLPQFAEQVEAFRCRHRLRYEFIYSHYWLSGWAGQMLQKLWDVPHLMMFHTVGASKQATGVGDAEPPLRLKIECELAHSCHRLIAATSEEKTQLIRYYGASPDAIRIVPLGVDLSLFRPVDRDWARRHTGIGAGEKVILYVGRIDAIKGIERLVRAVIELPDKRGVTLVIVGGDSHSEDEVERLKDMARAHGALGMLDFRGLVEHEQLPFFYNAADICAVVSYYESFGLVALEALACGTPVIASDVGILSKIIKKPALGRVLHTEHTPAALARHIWEWFQEPPPDPEAVRRGVREYGWADSARKFEGILVEFQAGCPTRL